MSLFKAHPMPIDEISKIYTLRLKNGKFDSDESFVFSKEDVLRERRELAKQLREIDTKMDDEPYGVTILLRKIVKELEGRK
jgi:hypothetical protein